MNLSKPIEEMKKDSETSLIKSGYKLIDGIWTGKHYNATITDRLGPINPVTNMIDNVIVEFKKNDSW